MVKIGVVIVTYNRLDKLKIALESFDKQTFLPEYIIVVNNHSTDGTNEFLENWKNSDKAYNKYVINSIENLGGSGGFYLGEEKAITLDADWIWVSDDDAYPDINALKYANDFLNKYEDVNNLAAICGKVMNNGKIHLAHRKYLKLNGNKVKIEKIPEEMYERKFFELNLFSYVGTLMNKEYLLKHGLVNKDYFIYFDDTEHSHRLSKYGKIICIPEIVITHDVWENKTQRFDWREYYSIRNSLLFYKTIGEKYYSYEYKRRKFRLFIKKILRYKSFSFKLIEDALNDAMDNKFGKSEIYIPGWKNDNK